MNAILIYGDDYYRTAFRFDNCTNEKYVAKKLIRPLFEKGELIINYDENMIDNNNYKKITIQLLNTSDIIFKGKIIIRIINNNIKDEDFGEDISIDLKEQLKEEIPINDDFDYLKSLFIQYFNQSMGNGSIIINFNWLQKIIGIDVAIKFDAKHYAYRGGYRINIYLSNEDSELLLKVKNVCKIFLKISGKKIPNSIKEILSNFDNFEKVDSIMNFLDTYSTKAEELILLLILSPYLKKQIKEEIPINEDLDFLKSLFIDYFNQSLGNGTIIINFNWLQKKIGIDVAIKVDSNHYGYRGGYRINIYLSNEDSELLLKVKNVCKIFLTISGKKIPSSIK